MKFMAGTFKWPSFTRCRHEAEQYKPTDELDRISGERRPGNSTPPPPKLPVAAGGGQDGGTFLRPKDSNAAVGVRDRATGKALDGDDRQTDRQTNRLSAHYSKIRQLQTHLIELELLIC